MQRDSAFVYKIYTKRITPKMIWNENDGIYINVAGITHFPFKVRRTWNHIIVCYILFSQMYSQNQFTCLLFFTPDFILLWKQAFVKHTNRNTGFMQHSLPKPGSRERGLRFTSQVYIPGSRLFRSPPRVTCRPYLPAAMQLDLVCSCFIAKYSERRNKPGQNITYGYLCG